MISPEEAMKALDRLIGKSRSFMYKPIQVAETLRLHREGHIGNLLNLESYRIRSRTVRNEVTRRLYNHICTSSARFQDDVWNEHAIPPRILNQLASLNKDGKIEKYIYEKVYERFSKIESFRQEVSKAAETANERIQPFRIEQVWAYFDQPALKKSVDKLFEITIYAILKCFLANTPYALMVKKDKAELFDERIKDCYVVLFGIQVSQDVAMFEPVIKRAGVANAADRGLDIWCNFGPAVQVKHISIANRNDGKDIIEDILSQLDSDATIVFCKNCPSYVKDYLLQEFSSLKGIITQNEVTRIYYSLCDRSKENGQENEARILNELLKQINLEFPIASKWDEILSRYVSL
jgi:type II restriction enzyme